ncbi:MAG TPA: asparagine synthase C-terminal domain-containing protein, partial [bacterium]|nr:asparagine synthase C-terminal domain-containing protein [bacterium]
RFSTQHYQFIVKPDVIRILPKLVWHYNEPFGDSSMVPTFYVAQETRRHITVALNGDGGDENLAGYPRYQQTKILERLFRVYSRVPEPWRQAVFKSFLKLYGRWPGNTFFRAWKWLEETEKYGFDYAYSRRLLAFSDGHKAPLYSEWMKERIAEGEVRRLARDIWQRAGQIDLLEKMMFSDFNLYLPEVLTVKMDIATMANSLEARSPFLDHKLIETIACFPPEVKMCRGISKYILKRKLKDFLPDEILTRKKMGFGLPVGYWFQNELKGYLRETLLSPEAEKRPYFNQAYLRQIIQEHTSGKVNHTTRLWCLLNLEVWHRLFIDSGGALSGQGPAG